MSTPYSLSGTIAAIATPPGHGGIGIVRLSGPDSLSILQRLLADSEQNRPTFTPRRMRHGWVHDVTPTGAREALDEVLAVHMPGPASFTGEDVSEIHCHGGQAIVTAILEAACRCGARMAERGEFTYRAFANGKYDLTQAEAIAEMIAAPSRQGVRLAQAKLSGLLGLRVDELRERVQSLRAQVVLAVDFPDEEEEQLLLADFSESLAAVRTGLEALLAGYTRARHWREGVPVILAGRVNAGKSSLMNALLGRNRAIVSPTPGTTRDFIEESLDLDGLRVRLSDTAGLRASTDPVEREGVLRALELADEARLILLVTDASRPLEPDEREFIKTHPGRTLVVRNKIDLLEPSEQIHVCEAEALEGCPCEAVSAKAGLGLERLAARLRHMAITLGGGADTDPEQGDIVPNLRQSRLLAAALKETQALEADVARGIACDLFSVRLDAMARHLGEITGYAAPDDVLGRIFADFCIGK